MVMTPNQITLIREVEATARQYNNEVELAVVRSLLAEGTSIEQVAFMMRFRYSSAVLKALLAEQKGKAAQ